MSALAHNQSMLPCLDRFQRYVFQGRQDRNLDLDVAEFGGLNWFEAGIVQGRGAGAVSYYFGECVASGKLADAAAQTIAAMQRYERACWLLQKFFVGKIPRRESVSGTGTNFSASCYAQR